MEPSTRRALRTPRAAGVVGILFAVLLAVAIVLMRIALPEGDAGGDAVVDPGRRRAVRVALEIVPFAGILFLWFMGALRAHVGEAEDKFIATVFLGSGVIFVASLFGAAAAAGGLLAEEDPSGFGRHFAYTFLTTYAMRMAAVFVFATSTIGHRLGALPRWLAFLGYAAGVILLFVGPAVPWSELIFPFWSLVVSLHLLRANFRA
ncbi:hypothetical protein [Streptomyces sp. NPDC000410]|uniref:hypothetical protein n=1 Tax=Streptomyces sp. NPDC000410 TaxID=3154254 RepID=UPI0033275745